MNYKPNPLLYSANEDFLSSFKLDVTMCDTVDYNVFSRAVTLAMTRYPYFCVYPEVVGNSIILCRNPHSVPVFNDRRCVTLGSDENFGHLISFGCEGKHIFINVSHYIADGMGIDPLLKTVLYLYVTEMYGANEPGFDRILKPTDPVLKEEYEYPFPDEPIEIDNCCFVRQAPGLVYEIDPDAFDKGGLYAYHLRLSQKAMMTKARPSDGSPVSFLSVMLYRSLCRLDKDLDRPVAVHVQHQYRAAVKKPLVRHSMVSYVPVSFPTKLKNRDVLYQNTVARGQILIGSEIEADLDSVNRLIRALPNSDDATVEQKKQSMRRYVENSIMNKTFGISYVGKMDWCGLEGFIDDIQVYIGEKQTDNMLLIEVMTEEDDFTLTFMQSGKGERYVNAFIEQLQDMDIPVRLVGEERYTLCDTKLPE